jgi:hypothetical protein
MKVLGCICLRLAITGFALGFLDYQPNGLVTYKRKRHHLAWTPWRIGIPGGTVCKVLLVRLARKQHAVFRNRCVIL